MRPRKFWSDPWAIFSNEREVMAMLSKALISLRSLSIYGIVALTWVSVSFLSDSCIARPNILMILADDLGYGDVGCYGHPQAKTPNIDQLAAQGVRFTQAYANGPECSPTRTAFLTGRYQQRLRGLECAIGTGNVGRYDDAIRLANERSLGLPADKTVIPGRLTEAGYRCGIFGKWHLGYEPKFNPIEHGWSQFAGYLGGNVNYFTHRETSELHVLFRGRLPIHRDGYMTHLITDDAIGFIEQRSDQPFFLFVSHECPHFPFQSPNDRDKRITKETWMKGEPSTYVEMLEDLDRQVGRLLKALDSNNIANETIVVFASDNGGFGAMANMGGLRGAKGTTFEGGIRVPLIVRWPGVISAGTESHEASLTFDLTHSFLRAAGAPTDSLVLDGVDILKYVAEKKPVPQRPLFWRGKRGERVWSAVRIKDHKFVRFENPREPESWLFDLANDRNEESPMSGGAAKQLTESLAAALTDWEREMDGD